MIVTLWTHNQYYTLSVLIKEKGIFLQNTHLIV
jgi:hypothetical protein